MPGCTCCSSFWCSSCCRRRTALQRMNVVYLPPVVVRDVTATPDISSAPVSPTATRDDGKKAAAPNPAPIAPSQATAAPTIDTKAPTGGDIPAAPSAPASRSGTAGRQIAASRSDQQEYGRPVEAGYQRPYQEGDEKTPSIGAATAIRHGVSPNPSAAVDPTGVKRLLVAPLATALAAQAIATPSNAASPHSQHMGFTSFPLGQSYATAHLLIHAVEPTDEQTHQTQEAFAASRLALEQREPSLTVTQTFVGASLPTTPTVGPSGDNKKQTPNTKNTVPVVNIQRKTAITELSQAELSQLRRDFAASSQTPLQPATVPIPLSGSVPTVSSSNAPIAPATNSSHANLSL
jgi:hypothetical protein